MITSAFFSKMAGEGLPKIAERLMNAAMLMERAKHIGAGPY